LITIVLRSGINIMIGRELMLKAQTPET